MKSRIFGLLFFLVFSIIFLLANPGNVYATSISVSGKAKVLNTDNSYLDFTLYNSNVEVDDGSGIFSGYAWLEDMGWVAFGTADNVDGPVTLSLTTGAVTGKAKVLNTDGFLYFTTNNSNVAVVLATGAFSGYVWSEDVGWIDFTDTGVSSASFLPTAPSGLSGSTDSTIAITWSWTDNSGNETGFRVDDSSNNDKSGNLAAGTISWQETGLSANTSYTRHVHAFNAIGDGTASSNASAITLSTAPTGSNITGSQAISTWTNNSSFVFTNTLNFGAGSVQYFRYVWDTSPTHTWTGSETQWTSGTLTNTATSDSNSWYLHLKGYNSADAANGTVDLGPYYYDSIAPIFSSKTTFSGWYNSNQTSIFTYTDSGGSGIASGTPVECIISTAGLAQTCSVTPNVCDTAGNCNTALVTSNGADIDTTAPATGSMNYDNGYFTSASVPLTVEDGTDGGSGINTSTRTFQRQSADLILGICGIYGSFSPITPDPTVAYPNFTDTTVVSGNCYKYEYQVSDTAGNQTTYTSGNAARIDTSNPSVPGTPSTTTPTNSASQTWTWVAATDAISDVANYLWRTTGTAVTSGTTAVTNVVTNLAEGVYNFFVKAVDTAGNQGAETSAGTLTVDTTAPTISLTTLSPNPNNNNTPSLTGSATDTEGTVSNVWYQMDGTIGSWTVCTADDGSFNSTTETFTCTVSPALSDGSHTIYVRATDSNGNTTSDVNTSTDTFTIDATAPTPAETPTPTLTPSSNDNNNNSSSVSNQPDYNCHSSKPLFISDLFQIDASSNKAKIYFTPQRDNNDYFISFSSVNNNGEEHGERVTLLREGVQSHTIYSLKPNTTYYVKVRGQNGCMPGDWSNIMKITTRSKGIIKTTVFYKKTNIINKIISKVNSVFSPKKVLENFTPESIPTVISQPKPNNTIINTEPVKVLTPKKKCFLWWCF